jgi:hypothetical protein
MVNCLLFEKNSIRPFDQIAFDFDTAPTKKDIVDRCSNSIQQNFPNARKVFYSDKKMKNVFFPSREVIEVDELTLFCEIEKGFTNICSYIYVFC